MGRFAFVFAIFAAPVSAAQAADISQLQCPLNALAPEMRANLGTIVATLGNQSDPAMVALAAAATHCQAELHWTADEREAAYRFALASVGHEELRRLLARDGIDVAPMERLILDDAELGRAVRTPAFAESDLQAFLQRNMPAFLRIMAGHIQDTALMERAGVYLAMRVFFEAFRHRFTGE